MKKFIIIICALILLLFIGNYAYYHMGFYIDLHPGRPVTTFVTTDTERIYMERDGETVPFEVRGVSLGSGIPGEWGTDYAIDEETYLRWFAQIQELGANTIRVYTILQDDFYNAFYAYNTAREEAGEEPLWLIHGVWVNDYTQFSHRDAYDDAFLGNFIRDCRTLVDVLHGQRSISLGYGLGSGSYRKDVSRWVLGYILGVEWEDVTVAYTDEKYPDRSQYQGTYLRTTEDASPFEAMLCQVGDKIIEYESNRYKVQKLVAFSNWPTTDPFRYPEAVTEHFLKCAYVDVSHITSTGSFLSGMFASYHVYPYFPDYLNDYLATRDEPASTVDMPEVAATVRGVPLEQLLTGNDQADFYDSDGNLNTYYAYLKLLNDYHDIPVVISEYGLSTGRGMSQRDVNTGRNQGGLTEEEQGQALIECYEDIMDAGSAGSCVFLWQDEWFKRSWNTMYAVDFDNSPYWSDYQTNGQSFGLLTFDPGEEESIVYVDGDPSEWEAVGPVLETEEGRLYMQYDEKYIYFYVALEHFDRENDTIYIPIDTTPKSGSTYCHNYDISFERPCDFLIRIRGERGSRVLVQERYESLRAAYGQEVYRVDPYIYPPDADSPVFKSINLILQLNQNRDVSTEQLVTYETGRLRPGNANPNSPDFDSLADYCFTDSGVEIRIPWQLLNFANPSEMLIHDDYYEHYGIEYIEIDSLYAGFGIGTPDTRIPMASFALKGWGQSVTYHERLKRSYYILQDYWQALDEEAANGQ